MDSTMVLNYSASYNPDSQDHALPAVRNIPLIIRVYIYKNSECRSESLLTLFKISYFNPLRSAIVILVILNCLIQGSNIIIHYVG